MDNLWTILELWTMYTNMKIFHSCINYLITSPNHILAAQQDARFVHIIQVVRLKFVSNLQHILFSLIEQNSNMKFAF